jgi:hypothetical protein
MDIDNIPPGVDFVDAINQAVGACDVQLVVIGKQWASIGGPDGERRLNDPADFVRLEVAAALGRDVLVIPVLVQGAPMPRVHELPEPIVKLARRNAIELSDKRWRYDVSRLLDAIEEKLEVRRQSDPHHGQVQEMPVPGWYSDPWGHAALRYWDGLEWTGWTG